MDKGISEMIRVAKQNATFCIVVPNVDWVIYRTTSKKGTDQVEINENLLSLKQWKQIFTKAGFRIISIHRDKWAKKLIGSAIKDKSKIIRMICKRLWVLLPLKYNYQFIFIIKCASQKTDQSC